MSGAGAVTVRAVRRIVRDSPGGLVRSPAGGPDAPGIMNAPPMISVTDAQARILREIEPVRDVEPVPVARALRRVLAQDVLAPFDIPPADNSAVDGYAVHREE